MQKLLLAGIISVGLFACGDKSEDTATEEVDTTEDTSTEDTDTTEDTSAEEADLANGQAVHDNVCMGCHAGNPNMENNAPGLSDEELTSVIQSGTGAMPGQNLSDTDLRDVIAYLRATYAG
jgi:mono/diheme cytochrome c family protein